ncbi:MAG: hypothetical protein IKU67_04025 [Firmicutes bacterium]|nr:hypothetical protein [Bacillota bacterium]
MTARNINLELESVVSEAEIALNKARVTVSDLYSGYFGKSKPEDWFLRSCYDEAQIKNTIVNDYLHELGAHLKEIREILEKTEDKTNENDTK